MSFARNSFSYPTASFGYYNGAPLYAGSGAGEGNSMAGKSTFAAGQGSSPANASGTWQPTILYMFGLIIAEMVVFGILAKHL